MIRSPHPLIAGLLSTSFVVTIALGWTGWRLVDQQRRLDQQIVGEQTGAMANAMAAGIRERLADLGERLRARLSGAGATQPTQPDIVLLLERAGGDLMVEPAGALPFVPAVPPPPSPSPLFAAAEQAEFVASAFGTAADAYRGLTTNNDKTVRAGALMRFGRVLRKAGRRREAVEASRQLAAMADVRIDTTGIPAALAGLDGERLAYRALGDADGEQRVADEIRRRLDAGTWQLTQGTAEFYRDEVSTTLRPNGWRLAAALAEVWSADAGPRTQSSGHTIVGEDRGVMVLWRTSATGVAMGAAFADEFIASTAPGLVLWQLTDGVDGVLAGASEPGPPHAASRIITAGGSTWMLRVWPETAPAAASGRRVTLVMALVAMLAFVWGTTFLMVRAIRREADVRKLQSDFVAAVSHEFRSPLTTMRQMAEMLDADRVPSEPRRHEYYRMLVAESVRLQRLVETLLNFGRMEAGTERYRPVDLDTAALVRSVVADVQMQAGSAGRRIETTGFSAALIIHGDEDAVRLALRNLVDNAVKYSPADSIVRVSSRSDGDRVAIAVTDDGPGIALDEQAAIFGTFVRGQAALEGRVPGTGVGLAMVQHVVAAHGGEIRVDSEPGRGSTFTLLLPAARLAETVAVASPTPAHHTNGGRL